MEVKNKMAGQEQKMPYDAKGPEKVTEAYKGPKKLTGVKDLLDGGEGLIAKENVADKYVQSGGQ